MEAVGNHDIPLVASAAADSQLLILLQQVLANQVALSERIAVTENLLAQHGIISRLLPYSFLAGCSSNHCSQRHPWSIQTYVTCGGFRSGGEDRPQKVDR